MDVYVCNKNVINIEKWIIRFNQMILVIICIVWVNKYAYISMFYVVNSGLRCIFIKL